MCQAPASRISSRCRLGIVLIRDTASYSESAAFNESVFSSGEAQMQAHCQANKLVALAYHKAGKLHLGLSF